MAVFELIWPMVPRPRDWSHYPIAVLITVCDLTAIPRMVSDTSSASSSATPMITQPAMSDVTAIASFNSLA